MNLYEYSKEQFSVVLHFCKIISNINRRRTNNIKTLIANTNRKTNNGTL